MSRTEPQWIATASCSPAASRTCRRRPPPTRPHRRSPSFRRGSCDGGPLPIEVHLYPDDLLVAAKIGVPTEVDAHDVAATIYAAEALIGKRG